jgi:hypothetical protein
VQAQAVCAAEPTVGEPRLLALPGAGTVDTYLRTQAGQERTALLLGECPTDTPTRQAWQRDGRSGTVLCFVLERLAAAGAEPLEPGDLVRCGDTVLALSRAPVRSRPAQDDPTGTRTQ